LTPKVEESPQLVYTPAEICAETDAVLRQLGAVSREPIRAYHYDTRLIVQAHGALFVALQGAGRSGSSYVAEAYKSGVRAFLVPDTFDIEGMPADATVLASADPLRSLQALATVHRRKFACPVVGITGSNGKTIVKEWLASLLDGEKKVAKSPRSFNSQLGVALSLLQIQELPDVVLIEAGISTVGEMQRLEAMIQPTLGIFCHFGDAHDEGFANRTEKLEQKLKLFQACPTVICLSSQREVVEGLKAMSKNTVTVGENPEDSYQILGAKETPMGWSFQVRVSDITTPPLEIAEAGPAALENAALAFAAAGCLGVPPSAFADLAQRLQPVSMRTEVISDNPEVTILNDAYNADMASVGNAFARFRQLEPSRKHWVILTDLEHQGAEQVNRQRELLLAARSQFGTEAVRAVGSVSMSLRHEMPELKAWPDVEALLKDFRYEDYRDCAVLLKGARKYRLERLLPLLVRRAHATTLRVNLNALVHNYHRLKQALPAGTRTCAMVKAAAYGSGSWQVAAELAREGVDYIAVAYPHEGIDLREKGIKLPILVLSADATSADLLAEFSLEPGVWSLRQLEMLADALPEGKRLGIHLEFDTGMGRLGFEAGEVEALLAALELHPNLQPLSVYTHLAAAEDPTADDFTLLQLDRFRPIWQALRTAYPNLLRHALNTGGLLRHPNEGMDMVRMGIGLYGVSPVSGDDFGLEPVGTLVTTISQIHRYGAGESVGYGRSQMLNRASRIGTLPIGYADGLFRTLGNGKAQFLVDGIRCPTVGRICMDMTMIDLTDAPNAQEGDEVVIFGKQGSSVLPVSELAAQAGTIAYELLTSISGRVHRQFVRE
jgi:Alr-MurF fusion protein